MPPDDTRPDELGSVTAAQVALDASLRSREEQLDSASQHVEELAQRYAAAVDRSRRSPIELVTGPAVPQWITHAQRATRDELRCLERTPSDTVIGDRVIYEREALPPVTRLPQASQVRIVASLPVTLYLADDRLAVLPLATDSALLIHPSAMLDAMSALFEALWDRAVPAPQADADQLSTLLLAGLTDQAIARRLGIGHRTAQRRIAALLKDLGARTRFQAGVQAALRDLKTQNPSNDVAIGR